MSNSPDWAQFNRSESIYSDFVVIDEVQNNNNNNIERNKYMREILPGQWVDVYDVIEAFGVTDGGMQHALKKILACGQRGHKDEEEDRKDILSSVLRSNEIYNRGSK